jgi:uncharacterized protein (DUF1800 family)
MQRSFLLIIALLCTLLPASARPVLSETQRIIHLLNRAGFGPRPGDVERVQKTGIETYIEQQLNPAGIDDRDVQARLANLPSLEMSTPEILRKYPPANQINRQLAGGDPAKRPDRREIRLYYQQNGLNPPNKLLEELSSQKLVRAVHSERQLQEVMTDFWYNHFNVYWGKGADRWLTTDFEMSAIRPNALGKFKDLVMATAKSPAMLFYLDNYLSMSPDSPLPLRAAARRRPGINENYARELMELHTMGVDGGYTQKDVQEVARAFTGWTIDQPRQGGAFLFRPRVHDNGEKVVLGQKIAAGGGIRDGEIAIDVLTRHPATARFISTKLVRRFVSDNPPESLIDRVTAVYTKTGGDIRAMLKTILLSSEFNSTDAYRAKTKSPFELAASAIRALGGDTDGSMRLAQMIGRMGQPLYQYQAPTGFPDREEQWMSSGTLIERLNFGIALASNRIPGTRVRLESSGSESTAVAAEGVQLAIHTLLANDISVQTRSAIESQMRPEAAPGYPQDQIAKAFALVLGSPEFQKK